MLKNILWFAYCSRWFNGCYLSCLGPLLLCTIGGEIGRRDLPCGRLHRFSLPRNLPSCCPYCCGDCGPCLRRSQQGLCCTWCLGSYGKWGGSDLKVCLPAPPPALESLEIWECGNLIIWKSGIHRKTSKP